MNRFNTYPAKKTKIENRPIASQQSRFLVTMNPFIYHQPQMKKDSSPVTNGAPERVFLIDSMSHIFRAFFAPMGMRQEPLRNSRGEVTQAVFVFTNMLRKLLNDEKPHYVAAVFDSIEPTFRHEITDTYKANRAEMPDDLSAQLPYIVRVCEVLNIPILKMPGYEADDIIGTLAVQAQAQGLQAVIVSNDKDMCQLVRDPLIVCMRQNSQSIRRKVAVPPIEWCDHAWVEAKFGVPPEKIIDLLGLMGDSVDNIPGAPGIGEKGAVQIVKEFGSVEAALTRFAEVKHKTYRTSLENNADLIRQSLDLATIRTDIDMKLDLDQVRVQPPNRAAAYQLFRELEFQGYMREFADAATAVSAASATEQSAREYRIVRKRADLDGLIESLLEIENWGFALADTAASPGALPFMDTGGTLRGLAIATAPGASTYIDLAGFEGGAENALAPLREVFSNGLLPKVVHDLKNAIAQTSDLSIEFEGVTGDTVIAAYLLDPTRNHYNLEDLVRECADVDRQTKRPAGWTEQQWRTAENADFTAQVATALHTKIAEQGLEQIYLEVEIPLVPLLYRLETCGMRVDTAALNDLSELFGTELDRLTARIYEVAGREFKINSPKQVGEILEELNISTGGRKTSTGRVSTSKDILEELAKTYELPRLIIEYREIDKLKSVYTDSLPGQIGEDGRIHCVMNQTVAATGRLSSQNPNLQNIPIRTELGQRIRRTFIPDAGYKLISADYSQLELRVLAHVTHDPEFVDAFNKGDDIHDRTARLVFGAGTPEEMKEKRRLAKIVNFAIAYAVEAFGLSQRVGLTVKEAKQVITDYYNTYKGVRQYMDDIPEKTRELGYVASIYGRRRPIPGINDRNFNVRSRAEREAINMPIQGTASDIVKIAMLKVDEALRRENLDARIIMQIHDELLVETAERDIDRVSAILKKEMEAAVTLDVPLVVDVGVGENWMDAK
jgi:DNA polymerase-1